MARRRVRRLTVLACAAVLVVARFASSQEIEESARLATLCKVWGLLKYHHPAMADRTDWDEVLIDSMPRFEDATTRNALNREVVALVRNPGVSYVFQNPRSTSDLIDRPLEDLAPGMGQAFARKFAWIGDSRLFEPETAFLLKAVVVAKPWGANRYVKPSHPNVMNPDFTNDDAYSSPTAIASESVRLLALFRYWNMVQYFFPYWEVMDGDWDSTLLELIPRFRHADGELAYHLLVAEMTARITDSHARVASPVLEGYFGERTAPFKARVIEDKTIITQVFESLSGSGSVRVGDVVTHVGGQSVAERRAILRPITHGSNDTVRERYVHERLFRTNGSTLEITVEGSDGRPVRIASRTVTRDEFAQADDAARAPLSAVLADNIGYVHMGLLDLGNLAAVMDSLRNTRGLVIDLRHYPNSTAYFKARYHSAATGRFQSPDPIMVMKQKVLDPQQWNMYPYVRNNPLRFVDPTGLFATDCGSLNAKQCAAAVAQIDAQVNKLASSKSAGDRAIAGALGTSKDTDNGVTIGFVTAFKDKNGKTISGKNGNTSGLFAPGQTKADGRPTAGVRIDLKTGLSQTALAATVTHEGEHARQRVDFVNGCGLSSCDQGLNMTGRQAEQGAYSAEYRVWQLANEAKQHKSISSPEAIDKFLDDHSDVYPPSLLNNPLFPPDL